jgi:uncharacterized protein YcnI
MRRFLVRAGVVLAASAAAALGLAAPALAHVTVNPSTATQGGYTKVAFRVPNEKDNADTTKLEVSLPEDHPIASVSLRPLAGWTATADTTTLATPITSDDGEITKAVTKITWTADAASVVKPGQFQEFEVSLGPLPTVDRLVFKAVQYYSDGDVVRWIEEPPAAGAAEPAHPAPVLTLAKAAAATDLAAGTAALDANTVATSGTTGSGSGTAVGLGVAGFVLGTAGLVVGLLAYRKANAATEAELHDADITGRWITAVLTTTQLDAVQHHPDVDFAEPTTIDELL